MSTIMVSCGEASGDLYAGALVRELRAADPGCRVFGLGGPRLAAAGAELAGDYRGISVTGLVEVLRVLPRTYALYRRLVAAAKQERPDVFVAIDYPDFNFRLGRAIHALGIPVVYYISPQVWAWRPGRIETLRRFVDRMLVIFPFEVPIYERAGVPVEFVGHPMVDLVHDVEPRDAFLASLGMDSSAPTVALLPGSRRNELRQILPPVVEAARMIARELGRVQFIVARAPHLEASLFAPLLDAQREGLRLAVVEGKTDTVLAASDAVITASGTATVQTALHEKPMVIVYRVSRLTYRLGIRFVNVDTYGMPNLVAGRTIVPELIQGGFTPQAVAMETLRYLRDPAHAERTREALRGVKARLAGSGTSGRAAAAVRRVASTAGPPAPAGRRDRSPA
jgi:lipid-A-disaccharide synthase